MTPPLNDAELGRLFADLRAADAQWVPPFAAVEAALHTGRRRRPRVALWWAAAAAVLLAAAGAAFLARRSAPPPPSLSQWRSPTEFLLRSPGDALLGLPQVSPAPWPATLNWQ
jgi:hypothetical protein